MSQYKPGRPTSDQRLKDWDTGRLSLLRLAVQRLETEVNRSMSNSALQSKKRKFSKYVPFVLDLRVNPGFRQASLDWSAPPGLGGHPRRQLLFYEVQHDSSAAFADPTILHTASTNINVAGLGLGEVRSFRIRVVTTLREVGKWSDVNTVTLARSKIQQTLLTDVTMRLTGDVGEWTTVLANAWQAVDSKACLNAQIAVACPHFDVTKKGGNGSQILRGGPAAVQFRWRVGPYNFNSDDYDTHEEGPRTIMAARPGYSDEANNGEDYNSVRTPTAFGTFMSPFWKPVSGIYNAVVLEAAKLPGSEWKGPELERDLEVSDPLIIVRRGQVIEVLEGF